MDTTPEYVPYLLAGQTAAAQTVGVNIYGVARELYVTNLSVLAMLGMVIKALHDHGVVLDAEWQTRLDAAFAGPWPPDLLNQVDPNPGG